MATPSGKPGRQYTFTVRFLNANGDPQDLTLADDYALLASVGDKKTITQWRKVSTEGYQSFSSIADAINGNVEITLAPKYTAGIDNATIVVEPVVWFGGVPFSSKDGLSFELIKIKASSKPKV